MPALRPEDRTRVVAAAAEVHARTGIEIVVVVRPASDHYALYPLLWASISAIVSLVVLGLIFPRLPLRMATMLQALILLSLSLAFESMRLRMWLVPRHARHAVAQAMARREFAAHTLSGDPGRKLILLFVSQAEHYFEVIADRASHQAAGEGTWREIVAAFTHAAQSGPLCDALLEAVQNCDRAVAASAESGS
jgi:putative membrane protein